MEENQEINEISYDPGIDPDIIDQMIEDIGSEEELIKLLKEAMESGEAKPVHTWEDQDLIWVKDPETGEVFSGATLHDALQNMTDAS